MRKRDPNKMTAEKFAKTVSNGDNMFPVGTKDSEAISIIAEHFLGKENCIICYPCSHEQWNSEIVYAILRKYPAGKFVRVPK